MIYTITFNPAIDYYITVPDTPLIDTEVNRTLNECFNAAGKGINVSMMLSKLQIHSMAIALIGGFTGDFIKEKIGIDEYITLLPIEATGINRINVKIYNGLNTFCINGKGVMAKKDTISSILAVLEKLAADDWVLICGSLVGGVDNSTVETIAELVKKRKAKLVIDMESLTIDLIKKCQPYLIKPNLYEFRMLMGDNDITVETIDPYIGLLLDSGLKMVLVSLGEEGAVLATDKTFYRLKQEEIKAVNKIGSGDAMLAAFVGKLSSGCTLAEALAWGGAAGMAIAATRQEVTYQMIIECLGKNTVKTFCNDKSMLK